MLGADAGGLGTFAAIQLGGGALASAGRKWPGGELGTAGVLGWRKPVDQVKQLRTDVDWELRPGRQFWNVTNGWQQKP